MPNVFSQATCVGGQENEGSDNVGLVGMYFNNQDLKGTPVHIRRDRLDFVWGNSSPVFQDDLSFPHDHFSTRWVGRIMAPTTGNYNIGTYSTHGVRMWLNDSLIINHWIPHGLAWDSSHVNLEAGQSYTIRVEYFHDRGWGEIALAWTPPGTTALLDGTDHNPFHEWIPGIYQFAPAVDTFPISNYLVKEKRINSFRKANHISEIDVLNNDGRRYVYGIPVYNLRQKEATFAVDGKNNGNSQTGMVKYTHDVVNADNTAGGNHQGKDWYYNSEEMPAYAHSFLLTGILSPDYVDLTGNGISDDDLGDAVKFNYSKVCGIEGIISTGRRNCGTCTPSSPRP